MAARKRSRATRPSRAKPAHDYHHGDLREALLEVALELIAERGVDDFTLREAARRVGVSHSAPYRHFADKDALLIELAKSGFEELARAGVEAMAGLDCPRARLRSYGAAYLRFAAEHPSQYRVMFGRAITKPSPELHEAGGRAFELFESTVAEIAASVGAKTPARDLAMAIMAGVHGLATLALDGMLTEPEELDPRRKMGPRYEALSGITLDLLDRGLASAGEADE
jgi:AcrR family transcriptional regulator